MLKIILDGDAIRRPLQVQLSSPTIGSTAKIASFIAANAYVSVDIGLTAFGHMIGKAVIRDRRCEQNIYLEQRRNIESMMI